MRTGRLVITNSIDYDKRINRNNMIQRKADKWGVNDDSQIEKIKKEAYKEGYIDGTNYIKDMVMSTLSNDAIAVTYQTLRHYRENLIKWLEEL